VSNNDKRLKPRYILAKPPKKVSEMTEEEMRAWAEELAQGLKLKPDGS
jgi:hypothetical protein